MNIFILNRGSSSIKCDLYTWTQLPQALTPPVWEAHLQWKNHFEEPLLTLTKHESQRKEKVKEKNAADALRYLLRFLYEGEQTALSSLNEIDVIGHRIVHGGGEFQGSTYVTSQVKDSIRRLSELAPLHNLSELEGIEILEHLLPKTPQIALFDTAFHHTLPKAAAIYPGPYRWVEEGIRRYGFHGISFQYCSKRSSEVLKADLSHLKMVICHLGSGASLCAVENGKSIDTTMGFTPLEGLMMDTRSGSIDPGIILYLLEKKKMSAEEISQELYKESGLWGISGISSDMRDILAQIEKRNPRAELAFEIYLHRLNACIGAMIAALQGVDVLVFTGGIGENVPLLRARVCEMLSFLGVKVDAAQNNESTVQDKVLSTRDSKVKVLLIHTQESFEMARECWLKDSS